MPQQNVLSTDTPNQGREKWNSNFNELYARPFFDIRDYGALTAAANNQTAIQAAIDAAENAGGGRVFVPAGEWVTGPLALGRRVWLEGAGMYASRLRLINGANADFITNKLSANGTTDPNAQFVAVRSLTLHGNLSNNTSGRGVYFTQNPTRGQTTGDDVNDPRMLLENLYITNTAGDAVANDGRSEMHMHNVNVFYVRGHGFVPAPDTFLSSCKTGATGKAGFRIEGSSIRLVNCKAFYAGDSAFGTPTQGHGFHVSGSGRGVTISNCEAQDCKAAGLRIDASAHRTIVESFVADSNSKQGKNLYAGIEIGASRHCIITAVCFERNDPALTASDTNFCPQRHALKLESGCEENQIRITHSATSGGAVVDQAIMPANNTAALLSRNYVEINNERGSMVASYVSSCTPVRYEAGTIHMTLTGNVTINATPEQHFGQELTFVFTQDATGGRTVTFNSQYKTSWTPNTTGGRINVISFTFNGSHWVQRNATAGLV